MLSTNCIRIPAPRAYRTTGDPAVIYANVGEILYEFASAAIDFSWAPDSCGREITECANLNIYCHQNGQSGVQSWYAFARGDHRELFLRLITIDKVGPSTAFKILVKNGSQTILDLIKIGDREAFIKLPGVGAKTGEAIAKVLFKDAPVQPPTKTVLDNNAVAAMRALGYDAAPAKEAIRVAMENKPGAETSYLVTEALRLCSN